MWRRLPKSAEQAAFALAVEFTGNADLYGHWMRRAVAEFHYACEHNLTDQSLNKQAWVGHAACCLAHRLPEYIVRKAWAVLTDEQREAANRQADAAVALWTEAHLKKVMDDGQLCLDFS